MTHPHVQTPDASNPFDKPAEQAEGKMSFGTLRVFTRKVNLMKGASYIMDAISIDPDNPDNPLNRLTYKDGNLYEFKGKQLAPAGNNTHVIIVITKRTSDGKIYNDFRDFMYWQKDVCQKVTMPSLQGFFGQKLGGIWGKTAEVQAEVVEIPDKQWTRQAFKIVKVFASKAHRETEETAFFGKFQQQTPDQIADEMMGEDPMPWGEDGEPVAQDDKPVGMTKEAAVALLPTLWTASGQDKDKFRDQLNGMPVVLAALGVQKGATGTLPEVAAFYAEDILKDLWSEIVQSDIENKVGEFLAQVSRKEVLLAALGGIDAPEIKAIYS